MWVRKIEYLPIDYSGAAKERRAYRWRRLREVIAEAEAWQRDNPRQYELNAYEAIGCNMDAVADFELAKLERQYRFEHHGEDLSPWR